MEIFFPGLVTSIQEQTGTGLMEAEAAKAEAEGEKIDLTKLQVPSITMSPMLAEVSPSCHVYSRHVCAYLLHIWVCALSHDIRILPSHS